LYREHAVSLIEGFVLVGGSRFSLAT